ncbi:MAG: hypothetical protein IJ634_00125 [Bacteroidales bacterium]|nr:hypothetical protein [Bacteroidales bacterium]
MRNGRCLTQVACASLSLVFAFSFLFLAGCSTEKAKWTNIQYHNVTCHYNVWWNGNESLKAGKAKLRQTAVDDYTRFLAPENLGDDELARSINPEMDRAIEKGVKGIQKHSIFVKGIEHVPYIKECYLMTAYATFYKHDYVSTSNTCDILIQQFAGTHAGDEGAVLLARCMTMEKRYDEAEAALDQLVQRLAKGNFSRSQRDKLYIAMVEATVPQEKYKKAVEYIHEAIDASSDRYTKARLAFLMAQIYRHLDKRSVAAKYYDQVLSYRPPYVLEFNAKLGMASCADLEHTDIAKLERQLDDMISDKKNEEYRDQIYFAKGEMFLGVKQPDKACDNYRLSVALATVNKAQRAQSALRMGEVQYEVFENYDLAQRYYDTAMQCIAADYPRYDFIRRRHEMLTELASYTRVYSRCDSLLAVASMPEAERLQLINQKIEDLKRQEEEAKERALLEELRNDARQQQNTLTGDWYFYTPNTVQKGKETFRQRWGMRSLEDLWFLSNKMSTFAFDDLPDEEESDADTLASQASDPKSQASASGDPNDPHSVAFYLKDLPATQQDLDSIDSLTSISLLNAGYIFYDGIGNIPRALECYHRLAKDYTAYPEIVQAFYMLYRIYDRQGNTPQANYYRDMVLMGFPDSDFANLIRDNEYYKELIRRSRRIEADYEQLYTQYANHRFSTVVSLADEAEEVYPDNPALHKFRYWKGLALARMGNRSDAIGLFSKLAALPKTDSIQPLAEAQLNILLDTTFASSEEITSADEQRVRREKPQASTPKPQASAEEEEPLPPESMVYRQREGQQYFVVVVVNDRTIKATELQMKLAQFNTKYYSNKGYGVNSALFTDTTQIITIHRFVDADEAIGYWRHLQQEESPLRQYADSDHRQFPISTQNYATFYNRKDVNAYLRFMERYLVKQQ